MGTRKTETDVEREDYALGRNADLLGSGLHVSANGRTGPYELTIGYLNRRELERLITFLQRYRDYWK